MVPPGRSFTIEALQADHGDCVLLRWGSAARQHLMVVDGGPGGVYERSLRPRLRAVKRETSPNEPLQIDLVMVSHLDDDHINGLLDLFTDVRDAQRSGDSAEWHVDGLWHNSFEDLTGAQPTVRAQAELSGELQATGRTSRRLAEVVASVGQARSLRKLAAQVDVPLNSSFDGVIAAPPSGRRTVRLHGLTMTVLAPSAERIAALQEFWKKQLRVRAEATGRYALVARYSDESVPNLASLVVLVRFAGRTVLLTGDARGDHILEGLQAAGLLPDNKPLHVDVLKVPHHGSDHNVETEFFAKVTADHYLISANGDYGNPEPATLQMIIEARPRAKFTIHLTNMTPRVRTFLARQPASVPWQVAVRPARKTGLSLSLT